MPQHIYIVYENSLFMAYFTRYRYAQSFVARRKEFAKRHNRPWKYKIIKYVREA